MADTERLKRLKEDGYVVIEQVVHADLVDAMRAHTDATIRRLAGEQSNTVIAESDDTPYLAPLIGLEATQNALHEMGIEDIRYWKADVIGKPPGAHRFYWHQDCIMWNDPRAYSDRAPMLFLLYYPRESTPESGCMRVLPGTHRKRHEQHAVDEAKLRVSNALDMTRNPFFGEYPEELDVTVSAGDVVVGDARLLHASHTNRSERHRSEITIWMLPWFSDLNERTQAWIHRDMHHRHRDWPEFALEQIEPVVPRYRGDAEPMKFNATPDLELMTP